MKWLLITLTLVFSSTLLAENSRPWWQLGKSIDETTGASDRLFTPSEKAVLHEYLRQQSIEDNHDSDDVEGGKNNKYKDKNKKTKHKKDKKKLPPGLQKKIARGGELPPGWQKKVARGEVLDGEIYETSEMLPKGILDQLEDVEGTSVRQVEDRVVRIMDTTNVILDVLAGSQ